MCDCERQTRYETETRDLSKPRTWRRVTKTEEIFFFQHTEHQILIRLDITSSSVRYSCEWNVTKEDMFISVDSISLSSSHCRITASSSSTSRTIERRSANGRYDSNEFWCESQGKQLTVAWNSQSGFLLSHRNILIICIKMCALTNFRLEAILSCSACVQFRKKKTPCKLIFGIIFWYWSTQTKWTDDGSVPIHLYDLIVFRILSAKMEVKKNQKTKETFWWGNIPLKASWAISFTQWI